MPHLGTSQCPFNLVPVSNSFNWALGLSIAVVTDDKRGAEKGGTKLFTGCELGLFDTPNFVRRVPLFVRFRTICGEKNTAHHPHCIADK